MSQQHKLLIPGLDTLAAELHHLIGFNEVGPVDGNCALGLTLAQRIAKQADGDVQVAGEMLGLAMTMISEFLAAELSHPGEPHA